MEQRMTERTYTADEVDAMIARAVAAAKQEFVCSTGLCHYKAQRTWVGLTDNEKIDCASPYDSRLCCVEATEAKLREKNQ
jgi:hypothetical protein